MKYRIKPLPKTFWDTRQYHVQKSVRLFGIHLWWHTVEVFSSYMKAFDKMYELKNTPSYIQ